MYIHGVSFVTLCFYNAALSREVLMKTSQPPCSCIIMSATISYVTGSPLSLRLQTDELSRRTQKCLAAFMQPHGVSVFPFF